MELVTVKALLVLLIFIVYMAPPLPPDKSVLPVNVQFATVIVPVTVDPPPLRHIPPPNFVEFLENMQLISAAELLPRLPKVPYLALLF